MSREKLSWLCTAAACPPVINALAAWPLELLLLAASTPKIMAPIIQGACALWWAMLRAMWRWVTWLSSWPSTEASSSRLLTTPTSPRCTPK